MFRTVDAYTILFTCIIDIFIFCIMSHDSCIVKSVGGRVLCGDVNQVQCRCDCVAIFYDHLLRSVTVKCRMCGPLVLCIAVSYAKLFKVNV